MSARWCAVRVLAVVGGAIAVVVALASALTLHAWGAAGVLLAGVVLVLGLWVQRPRRAGTTTPAPVAAVAAEPPRLTPVTDLSTHALGREWLRTAAALGAELEPGTRQHVLRRRQDTLDELERRDPQGFARWLADGAQVDSDPASWVRRDPRSGPAGPACSAPRRQPGVQGAHVCGPGGRRPARQRRSSSPAPRWPAGR